jgi:hypothetical protein
MSTELMSTYGAPIKKYAQTTLLTDEVSLLIISQTISYPNLSLAFLTKNIRPLKQKHDVNVRVVTLDDTIYQRSANREF